VTGEWQSRCEKPGRLAVRHSQDTFLVTR
jgi:hypothetical protein